MIDIGSIKNVTLNFSLKTTNLGIFQNIPKHFEDSYSKNYSKKTTKILENSKNKTILRIRILVNTGPDCSKGGEK